MDNAHEPLPLRSAITRILVSGIRVLCSFITGREDSSRFIVRLHPGTSFRGFMSAPAKSLQNAINDLAVNQVILPAWEHTLNNLIAVGVSHKLFLHLIRLPSQGSPSRPFQTSKYLTVGPRCGTRAT
jgi:hypothetical protein